MPVWGDQYASRAAGHFAGSPYDQEAFVRGRVLILADYLRHIHHYGLMLLSYRNSTNGLPPVGLLAIRSKVNVVLSMRNSLMRAAYLLAALIVAGGASNAAATPLTPFRYQTQAQRHCPDDTIVWLDFRKGIYYFKRQNRYGQGNAGGFVCREEARSNGYRRSLLGLR